MSLKMRGKCRFTRSHHLEARKRCRSRSVSSTIEGLMTLDMTSTSIDATNTRMLRSEATAPTAANATIVMRTGWL